jgi:ATP-dependent phosphofructokinase / diphosphate-dependent phosphofructokinase
MHIGILTGGGDCPGLNAVIRTVTLALLHDGGPDTRVSGIGRGFLGLITGDVRPLDAASVDGIQAVGGTVLGTHNRCDPFHYFGAGGADVSDQAVATLQRHGIDALVAIGGDGTMAIAHGFERKGVPVIGVPKTIDNDLFHTDRSFGFDSAVAVVSEALDRLLTTARSHGRVMIVETMGRYAGWIALEGGLAGGADAILLPEIPYDLEAVAALCQRREAAGGFTLVAVAEGALPRGGALTVQATIADSPDPLRLGGVCHALQQALQPRLASEVRTTQLGHVQRGGSPTAFDRVLAMRFGWHAAELLRGRRFGRMVVLQGDACTSVALSEVAGRNRTVPLDHPLVAAARGTGVCLGEV